MWEVELGPHPRPGHGVVDAAVLGHAIQHLLGRERPEAQHAVAGETSPGFDSADDVEAFGKEIEPQRQATGLELERAVGGRDRRCPSVRRSKWRRGASSPPQSGRCRRSGWRRGARLPHPENPARRQVGADPRATAGPVRRGTPGPIASRPRDRSRRRSSWRSPEIAEVRRRPASSRRRTCRFLSCDWMVRDRSGAVDPGVAWAQGARESEQSEHWSRRRGAGSGQCRSGLAWRTKRRWDLAPLGVRGQSRRARPRATWP